MRKRKDKTNGEAQSIFHDEQPKAPEIAIRQLRYDFTASEIHDFSLQLATETKKASQYEEQKKSATSEYTAKINSAKESCSRLSNLVSNGYEYRDIECTIKYHSPAKGMKTFTRKDNGEKIVEKMDQNDWNLFNQESDVSEGEVKLLG